MNLAPPETGEMCPLISLSRNQWSRIKSGSRREWTLRIADFEQNPFKVGAAISFVIASNKPFVVVGGQLQLKDAIWVRVTKLWRDLNGVHFSFEREVPKVTPPLRTKWRQVKS